MPQAEEATEHPWKDQGQNCHQAGKNLNSKSGMSGNKVLQDIKLHMLYI